MNCDSKKTGFNEQAKNAENNADKKAENVEPKNRMPASMRDFPRVG